MADSFLSQRKVKGAHLSLRRILRRVLQKPEFLLLRVWKFNYQDVKIHSSKLNELEVRELGIGDREEINSVAEFGFYTKSVTDVRRNLLRGEKCYIAVSNGQVIASLWVIGGGFYEGYLQRNFKLGDDEVYYLGAYTKREFRGLGVIKVLVTEMSRLAVHSGSETRAFMFVRLNNQASQQSCRKLGFQRCGYVGFLDLLGFRYHFLTGHEAFPQTARRFFLQMFC